MLGFGQVASHRFHRPLRDLHTPRLHPPCSPRAHSRSCPMSADCHLTRFQNRNDGTFKRQRLPKTIFHKRWHASSWKYSAKRGLLRISLSLSPPPSPHHIYQSVSQTLSPLSGCLTKRLSFRDNVGAGRVPKTEAQTTPS